MLLLLGILISYIGLYLVPSLRFLPIPYTVFLLFSFVYFKDFRKALFLSAIFSIPYSLGKTFLNFDDVNILMITPFSGFVLCCSFLSIKKVLTPFFLAQNIFLLLFFIWGVISFLLVNSTPLSVDGIYNIALAILLYFLTKNYMLEVEMKKAVLLVLLSIIAFESMFAIIQFFIDHPLGRFVEEGMVQYPFGRLASEIQELFRPSGTINEPTWFARLLTMLLPVLLYKPKLFVTLGSRMRLFLLFLAVAAIIVSFTRYSIFIAFILILLSKSWKSFNFKKIGLKFSIFFTGFLAIVCIYLFPLLTQRLITSSASFEEMGSFNVRIKLIQEALNLISQYPLFGVGLRQFSNFAIENNITGFFQLIIHSVHNVPLLIASEMGIPALIFFIGFILFSYLSYWNKRCTITNQSRKRFLDMIALGGLAYLLESQMGTIFISPHLRLFLFYMSIISS